MAGHHRDESNRFNLERNRGLSTPQPLREEERRQGSTRKQRFGDMLVDRNDQGARRVHAQHPFRDIGHYGKGPKNYIRSDESIMEDVAQALYESDEVDASEIEVDVQNHMVYLRGEVDDRVMKRLAEDTTEDVPGVEDIHNELKINKKRETHNRAG